MNSIIRNLVIIFSIISFQSNAQENNIFDSKGVLMGITEAAQIDKLMPLVNGVGSNARDLINEQSIKSYMMPPRKTVDSNLSLAYALTSSMEYYINLHSNYKDNLSPDYLALNVKKNTASDLFTFLASGGTVNAAIMPFETKFIPTAVYSTPKYKIQNYLYIFRATAKNNQKIFEIKKALMRGNPVIIELLISEKFKSVQNTKYWFPEQSESCTESDFLVVVGYDEERKAFELRSNRGMEWGNKGYIWVSFEDIGNLAQNAYVLIL